ELRILLRIFRNRVSVETVTSHAARARLRRVCVAHMILPLRAALLAAPVRPKVVQSLTWSSWVAVTPKERALVDVRIAWQESSIPWHGRAVYKPFVLKSQIALIHVANAGMALPANLILLVYRETLQAVADKALLGIKLQAGRRFLFGNVDVLASGTVAAFAPDRQFADPLRRHLPMQAA